MALLEVRDLRTSFRTDDGVVKAVDGVSFSVEKGQTLGIVGESGSGKSVTCLTIMGLNAKRNTISSGHAMWKGEDLLTMPQRRLRDIRGNEIAMIFQDPMTSLNPVHRIGKQLTEAIMLHRDVTKKTAKARALELLRAVGIPRAERRIDDYPHQFSGGMRQRVMIAMALVNDPDLLIADEPTTVLNPPRGCRFNPRCPYVMNVCKQQEPDLRPVSGEPEHLQACHLDEQTKDREAAKLLAGTLAEAS